jgi:hypothetical protein
MLDPEEKEEEEDYTILQNTANYSHCDSGSHPRAHEYSF